MRTPSFWNFLWSNRISKTVVSRTFFFFNFSFVHAQYAIYATKPTRFQRGERHTLTFLDNKAFAKSAPMLHRTISSESKLKRRHSLDNLESAPDQLVNARIPRSKESQFGLPFGSFYW
jgi:hypothetical protein